MHVWIAKFKETKIGIVSRESFWLLLIWFPWKGVGTDLGDGLRASLKLIPIPILKGLYMGGDAREGWGCIRAWLAALTHVLQNVN